MAAGEGFEERGFTHTAYLPLSQSRKRGKMTQITMY